MPLINTEPTGANGPEKTPRARKGDWSGALADSCTRSCCMTAGCEAVDCLSLSLSLPTVLHVLAAAVTGFRDDTGAPGRNRTSRAAVSAIRLYQQRISPTRPPCCRLTPTCSSYAAQAIIRHGALRGGIRTIGRLRRCADRQATRRQRARRS